MKKDTAQMISNTIVDVATRLHGVLAYVAENEDEEVSSQQRVVIGIFSWLC
jgi:hypothetical protein